MREVGDSDAVEGKTIPCQTDQKTYSPSMICREQLEVHPSWREWENSGCDRCEVCASLVDRHELGGAY